MVIAVLFDRVADAEANAEVAAATVDADLATQEELDALRADMERVEAGAALYASQIEGFQEQIVALEPENAAALGAELANRGVAVTARAGTVRVAPYVGTDDETLGLFEEACAAFAQQRS